jgi:hypothetical protein
MFLLCRSRRSQVYLSRSAPQREAGGHRLLKQEVATFSRQMLSQGFWQGKLDNKEEIFHKRKSHEKPSKDISRDFSEDAKQRGGEIRTRDSLLGRQVVSKTAPASCRSASQANLSLPIIQGA